MARLDPAKRAEWKSALSRSKEPWIAVGLDLAEPSLAARLEGLPGLADWILHGQVSHLMAMEKFAGGKTCLVPGDPLLGRPSFLFVPINTEGGHAAFVEKTRKLGVKEIALAESTFPEDFLAKVKQTFKKEGIRFTNLEPLSS